MIDPTITYTFPAQLVQAITNTLGNLKIHDAVPGFNGMTNRHLVNALEQEVVRQDGIRLEAMKDKEIDAAIAARNPKKEAGGAKA